MASITSAQLASLEEYGVIARRKGGSDLYSEDAVEIAAAAGGLLRAGIDARHLRAWRTSVEREVGLYEQLVMPILRHRNPEARSLASAQLERAQRPRVEAAQRPRARHRARSARLVDLSGPRAPQRVRSGTWCRWRSSVFGWRSPPTRRWCCCARPPAGTG